MKKIFLVCLSIFSLGSARAQDLPETEELLDTIYPYVLPIWGQKVAERGYKTQLPFGLNLNYVHNNMDLYVSEFFLNVGDDPNSALNQLLLEYVTLETLNFQTTSAVTDGLNLRADFWLFPFINFYGIYAQNSGSTTVGLAPEWYDENGNLVLALPEFGATAYFDAESWGIGTTWVYGYKNYFVSVDANYTQSYSELLDDPAKLVVASGRVGTLIPMRNPNRQFAVYVGGMFRNFVEANGNFGSIKLNEVFPEIGRNVTAGVNERLEINNNIIEANNNQIAALDPNKPLDAAKIAQLEAENGFINTKNQALIRLDDGIQTVASSEIRYKIKKEIINPWSMQFGFNFQWNQHFMLRGEYGIANGNRFLLTGLQYRFGL